MMKEIPVKKTGLGRLRAALFYSLSGLQIAFEKEAAFRQELFLFAILSITLFFLPVSTLFKSVLFSANTIILITELLNSAIESVVDLVSPDYHILAKQAKDLGSAAVLLSIIMVIILWGLAIRSIFSS